MKYGKLLARAKKLSNPAWIDQWMDYNKLKRVIHDIAVETGGPEARARAEPGSTVMLETKLVTNSSPEKSLHLQRSITPTRMKEIDAECVFFSELKKNLDAVAKFYEREEVSLVARTKKLKSEIDAAVSLANQTNTASACLSHFVESLKVLYVDLMMLENYAVMNYGGFAKILKKHDKNTPFSTQEKYLRKMVNPCSFAFYPLLKQSIVTVESSFGLLLGQSSTRHEDTGTDEAPNDFNVNLGEDNEKNTNNKIQEAISGGRQTRTRLDTADRQKLESLEELSGILSSKSSCTNKECTSDDEDGHEGAEGKMGLTTLGQKRKNVAASSVTNVLEDRQVAAKRRFLNINASE